jgi:hypothetical protein
MADIEEEKVTDKSAKHITARDGDPYWFGNPQFVRVIRLAMGCEGGGGGLVIDRLRVRRVAGRRPRFLRRPVCVN